MKRSFRHGERGAVAVMVGLIMVFLVIAAAAAIDVGRLVYAHRTLQGLANAATITAAATKQTDPAKLTSVATDYVNANMPSASLLVLDVPPVVVTFTPGTASSPARNTISIGATVTPFFGTLVGYRQVRMNVTSRADQPQPGPADVVLALDTTTSMNDKPSTGGTSTKIQILRTAATALVNKLMTTTNPNIQFGIVPYASVVNVGLRSPVPDWILEIDRFTSCATWTWENPSGKCINTWVDCFVDGIWKTKACVAQDCSSLGKQICTSTRTFTWGGCVGARSPLSNNPSAIWTNTFTTAFLDKISSPTNPKYSGQSTLSYGSCGTQILGLTNDKTAVLARITALTPSGETHLPSGLIWGWNLLEPAEPYTARTNADLKALGGKKYLVLMTDGINSAAPRLYDGAYMPFSNTSLVAPFNPPNAASETRKLTVNTCANIKGDTVNEITIFTVLFDVTDADVKTMLTDCAVNTGGRAFSASDSVGLMAAFDEIANQIMTLKVTQ